MASGLAFAVGFGVVCFAAETSTRRAPAAILSVHSLFVSVPQPSSRNVWRSRGVCRPCAPCACGFPARAWDRPRAVAVARAMRPCRAAYRHPAPTTSKVNPGVIFILPLMPFTSLSLATVMPKPGSDLLQFVTRAHRVRLPGRKRLIAFLVGFEIVHEGVELFSRNHHRSIGFDHRPVMCRVERDEFL